ncbi:ADP-ribose pyrophosphatase YjhB (NUDIX family) [Haloactinospora alba]|uniref:ADP-ribose pyrophosphatase YjhB (NUDIX family) n=1 Tax=Haloactinospora alba TaxID=405555 RepID=A0A543NA11_9ACTN|nr:NUDIX hydrolase [Haloactinospora alba]TQN28667.1 ADP-ribose pyrophosphatase YjhB (NUDIX family) [Haloactinospora alba]
MSAGDGDGWVFLPDGTRRWGRYGASGLLLCGRDVAGIGHILLQHRSWWSHHGNTWGLPGGALDSGESPVQGALREFREEVAGELGEITVTGIHRQEHTVWRYDTVLAQAAEKRAFSPGSAESADIRWVRADRVESLPLLPAFRRIWPEARAALERHPVLVVDAHTASARLGGARELRASLAALARHGVPGRAVPQHLPQAPLHRWFPRVLLAVDGAAPTAPPEAGVEVVTGYGTSSAVENALNSGGSPALVVTRDEAAVGGEQNGVRVLPPEWLRELSVSDSQGT